MPPSHFTSDIHVVSIDAPRFNSQENRRRGLKHVYIHSIPLRDPRCCKSEGFCCSEVAATNPRALQCGIDTSGEPAQVIDTTRAGYRLLPCTMKQQHQF